MAKEKIIIKGKEIDLIKSLGLENEPIEVQEKIVDRMANIVLRRSFLEVLSFFSEEELKDINTKMTSGNIGEVVKLLDEKVPNFDKILSNQISSLQEEMLNKK